MTGLSPGARRTTTPPPSVGTMPRNPAFTITCLSCSVRASLWRCPGWRFDPSAGPGEAKAALITERPYFRFCCTEPHVQLLYRHRLRWLLSEMGSEGLPLDNAKNVERVGKTAAVAMDTASKQVTPLKLQSGTSE